MSTPTVTPATLELIAHRHAPPPHRPATEPVRRSEVPRSAVPFVERLGSFGDAVALHTVDGEVSYRDLAGRVDALARRLGTRRRLLLLAASNDVDTVVAYLAALAGRHPVLLAPADGSTVAALVQAYDPDVVAGPAHAVRGRPDGTWRLDERRPGSAHDLHPDLALLLSTSGSTGSPKLVRLSAGNLQANAESIAAYLDIRAADRAVTSLPVHYCYGLSVINSHLLRGAGLVLTGLSVLDDGFWDVVRSRRATTFAAVPYTFDLLDRIGFADLSLPHLRYVTQAGGRLDPARVRRYAELGRRQGWDLVVMYGQTEATARMAYLPPALAVEHPQAIGVAVPGGELTLEPVADADPGVGELVYRGPNVMLGYARTPADLALGRTVDALRTGDLARRAGDGLFEVVGRRSRFVKIAGVRVDLGSAEALLARRGLPVACAGDDDALVVAVEGGTVDGGTDTEALRRTCARELGVPAAAVRVLAVEALPRLPSGKPDAAAVAALARTTATPTPAPAAAHPAGPPGAVPVAPSGADSSGRPAAGGPAGPGVDAAALRDLYAELLDRPDATVDSTFVGLGGDSLSYVEMSVRLEESLGHLPPGWHTLSVRELAAGAPAARGQGSAVETSVLLRAVAIVLIVGTHSSLFTALGSAHVLVAVAGFNMARFQLTDAPRRQRVRSLLAGATRIAVPTVAWVAFAMLLLGAAYAPANLLLLNSVVGAPTWNPTWHFWFIEVLTYLLLGGAALAALPWADALERRAPFAVAAGVAAAGLLTRFEVVDPGVPHTKPVLWIFALGWAAARARTPWQRGLVSLGAGAGVPGFFDDPLREALILAGVLLLVWAPSVRVPAGAGRVAGVLAGASLYVYVTHWQVYPRLDDVSPLLAVLASLLVGIAWWKVAGPVAARVASGVASGGVTRPRGSCSRATAT